MIDINNVSLVYVDDNIQKQLSYYLSKKGFGEYNEIIFDNSLTYKDFLGFPTIKKANIIIIDSRLFENSIVGEEKCSGEELMLALRKVYPFVEVIVVSQNEDVDQIDILAKFHSERGTELKNAVDYYDKNLFPRIESAIRKIRIVKKIGDKISKSQYIDKYLVDNIKNSIDGIPEYDGLTKKDVDELILSFKELESKL